MPDPEISIVIVSWNVRDLLIACLRSIERFVQTPYEVIVIDNHSADGTVETLRREFSTVSIIANPENFGFARANNQGWQRAHGRYIFFLNPDTTLIDDPFPPMLTYARQHQRVGCVGPRLLNPDRTHQPSVRRFPRFRDQALVLLKLRSLQFLFPWLREYQPQLDELMTPRRVEQVMGAALLIPRTVLEEAGTFDEGYWIWFEEVDLCQRLTRRGFEIIYLPTTQIIHYGGQSFAQHLSLAKQVWFMRSLARYARKYWSLPSVFALYLLMPISYLLTVVQSFIKPK